MLYLHMRILVLSLAILVLTTCSTQKEKADILLYNGKIYTVDSAFTVVEAIAIKNGKVLACGSTEALLSKYDGITKTDLEGKAVYPGFIDAHCHFLGYGLGLGRVDLRNTQSFEEVLQRVIASSEKNLRDEKTQTFDAAAYDARWIVGRGWDQNDWTNKNMPDRKQLDSLFPNRPVYLTRIDGHAALVNGKALQLAGITASTKISGGEIILKNGAPSGVLVDNALDLVQRIIPGAEVKEKTEALLNAQENCFAMGLTTVVDAGLMASDVALIDQLQKQQQLKMRMYVMLSDSAPNYEAYLEKGPYKTDYLNVRSFKFYVDGALGSRGACLYENYSDKKDWKGFLLASPEHFSSAAQKLSAKGFQMNAHCIGDSAFGMMTTLYTWYCTGKGDKRWRIEHSQITRADDIKKLNKNIIPSVQPTHATSDMYWAAERLGKERVKSAYAYKQLLQYSGVIALGTDFPVEDISPFKTFYAAVERKDDKGFPQQGFQKENALTREETLRGMSIWAAYANFEEKEKGSLEPGKFADFVVLDTDIMQCSATKILTTKVLQTFVNGTQVYKAP